MKKICLKTLKKTTQMTESETIRAFHIEERKKSVRTYHIMILDLKEYIKNPIETVSVLQIRHQIDWVLADIRRIDFLIKRYDDIILSDKISELTQIALTKENELNKVFTSADCPKISQSLFTQPFI